ncbi:MAG: hypothetical protein ABII18_06210 [bacterium]|nr:hypothetical protein [bacterium]MBU1917216.1 hypothetical protein [bacterium]
MSEPLSCPVGEKLVYAPHYLLECDGFLCMNVPTDPRYNQGSLGHYECQPEPTQTNWKGLWEKLLSGLK